MGAPKYGFDSMVVGEWRFYPDEGDFEQVRRAAWQHGRRRGLKMLVRFGVRDTRPGTWVQMRDRDGTRDFIEGAPKDGELSSHGNARWPIAEVHWHGEKWITIAGEPGSSELKKNVRSLKGACYSYGKRCGVQFTMDPQYKDGRFGFILRVKGLKSEESLHTPI